MSSILKALKKLEEEKSLQQNGKEINLSREILKSRAERNSSAKWLWLLLISAATLIILLSLALFHTSAPKEAARPSTLQTDTHLHPSVSPPLSTALPLLTENGKKAVTALPSPLKGKEQKLSQPTGSPAGKQLQPLPELPKTPVLSTEPVKKEPTAKAAPPRAVQQSESILTLSGIAWNKDSTDRLAIINGQPATTGTVINGAVVEEILPDRVRMNHSGRTFDLHIGRNSRTE